MVNGRYLLKKFPGKGGWTYAEIPEIAQNSGNPFGWVRVSGRIDSFQLKQYKLMPMGEGRLFLPVRAEVRKKINKVAGDWVHIILEVDASEYEVPEEIIACLEQEPGDVLLKFQNLPEGEQKAFVDWIYNAKTDQTRVRRIVRMIDNIAAGKGFYDMAPVDEK